MNVDHRIYQSLCRVFWYIEERIALHSTIDMVIGMGILPIETDASRESRVLRVMRDVRHELDYNPPGFDSALFSQLYYSLRPEVRAESRVVLEGVARKTVGRPGERRVYIADLAWETKFEALARRNDPNKVFEIQQERL